MLNQNTGGDNQWVCQSLTVVDACRGTSVSQKFRGDFDVFDGPCKGKILTEYPVYIDNENPRLPKYMYAVDVYSDDWSVKELQGLVRWRISSFDKFDDKT